MPLVAVAVFLLAWIPAALHAAADKQKPIVNKYGAPVLDADGHRIKYDRKSLEAMARIGGSATNRSAAPAYTAAVTKPRGFMPAGGQTQLPFWQYATFGSGIGSSNIVIGPTPQNGAPEIIIGGNSRNDFGPDDFWQLIRYNSTTGNYDQVFVSRLYCQQDDCSYGGSIQRIGLANVTSTSNAQIVIMLNDGRIYLYDFASKTELGYFNTGISGLEGLSLTDLDGDGLAELIVTTSNDLFVFNNAGALLWQVQGAGGYDVVAGRMDNGASLKIAATNGKVVDAGTHAIVWNYAGGFGAPLKLAPFPGESYQQLISASSWEFIYSYDVGRQLPRWSIDVANDYIGAMAVADVDGGLPEVIAGEGQSGVVHVYDLNTQAEKWEAQAGYSGVNSIAAADVNGDATPELLWAAGYGDTGPDYLYVTRTTGGHDVEWQSIDLQGPFLGPAIGDLDGDGQPELVVCSSFSNSGYDSGRILVFDLATLTLRAISDPVVDDSAWTGVHDLKLRDVQGNGRMEIVIAADNFYDGAIEIYQFDSNNTFTRIWANATRPSNSPFNFTDVADLDNNGSRKVIGGANGYVFIYDYPSGVQSWQSVHLPGDATGLLVQDLNGDGNKEIAALVSTGDLYTWDGPTRQLRNLRQGTGGTLMSNGVSPAGLVLGDTSGVGHFLQWGNNSYTETFARQLGNTSLDGVNVLSDGWLWTGTGSAVNLRYPSTYDTVVWQGPMLGGAFGRFVATDIRNNQNRVFGSGEHTVTGFTYTVAGAPVLVSAVSRKIHGAAGPFDVTLPLSGSLGIECRTGGVNGPETLVLTFDSAVVSGHAAVTSGVGSVQGNPTFSGNQMTISLGGVTNAQWVTVTVTDVAGTTGPPLPGGNVTFGVLLGDVNSSHIVNASDVAQTKSRLGQTVDATNFRSDVNANGSINAGDLSIVKANLGTGLP
jgi:hypothetical protein